VLKITLNQIRVILSTDIQTGGNNHASEIRCIKEKDNDQPAERGSKADE
jgi:hypothetical protein